MSNKFNLPVIAMDENHQSQPSSSSSPPPLPQPAAGGGGGGERMKGKEVNSETKAKSRVPCNNNTILGRHRMTAAITRLENEITIIQKELEELESIGGSSIVCRELVSIIDSIPDPLLPETRGPSDVNWDRWFKGAHGSRNHRRWI